MAHPLTFSNNSTHVAAVPYGAATLAVGAIGAGLALLAAATALKVAGIVIGLFGVYAFGGVLFCAVRHSHSADAFRANVHDYIAASFGIALSTMIEQVARTAFQSLLDTAFGRR